MPMTPHERHNRRQQAGAEKRRRKAQRLRDQGYSLVEIGRLFGVTRQRIWNLLNSGQ